MDQTCHDPVNPIAERHSVALPGTASLREDLPRADRCTDTRIGRRRFAGASNDCERWPDRLNLACDGA